MRKILLGTTAVVGAALLGMTGAQAQEAPTVRVGGYFEFTGGYIDDDADQGAVTLTTPGRPNETVSRSKFDFRTDLEISVIVRGKAANGLSYGAEIEFQIDANNTSATAVDTDEAWGFISSPTLGTLQFGDNDNAADQLKVAAPGVTNLGESGGWDEFIVPAADGTRYILSTINDGNDSSKIIYLSPQFFGFDFGVSFAPNGNEGENFLAGGSTAFQRDPNQGSIRNELSGAIRYRGSFGNVGVAAAFSAMTGDAPDVHSQAPVQLQDPNAYQAGLNLSAFGVTVGGHYMWGKYAGASFGRQGIREGLGNSSNWTLGATYRAGAISVGAFYSLGQRDNGGTLADREQRAIGVGAVYTIAPGLEAFANYTNISDENIANNASNPTSIAQRNRDIDVFILGTRLAF
jgi:predicted porin